MWDRNDGPIFAFQPPTMKVLTTLILLPLILLAGRLQAQSPGIIYSYAVGNWRDGPVVEISPLFQTTEQYTTPQLIALVKQKWPKVFTDSTDIDIQRFATKSEGEESRVVLKAKYGRRNLPVDLMPAEPFEAPVPVEKTK
jgi:hypothetical protein